jgi:hypothetical protein
VSATDDSSLSVPVGPKAIRATQNSTKGPVVYIKVPAGGMNQTLYLNYQ